MTLTQKDKDAIMHVAGVSDHPHAAMIVKQLITGWEVESHINNDLWIKTNPPKWYTNEQYRLIEPKPIKPAYRVYRYKGERGTNTQDRHTDGSSSHIGDITQVVFMGDWIEYDDPTPVKKQWPTPLVERIAAIDIKAAEWIVKKWNSKKILRESRTLDHMFTWVHTEQGHAYWEEISKKLGEE